MSDTRIEVESGKSVRLLLAGTRCENNVVVTAKGSPGGGDNYYDIFWDTYQNYGNRTDYSYAFLGNDLICDLSPQWSKESFKPKYNMEPISARHMFDKFKQFIDENGAPYNLDLESYLNQLGITLDFSKCTIFDAAFNKSCIEVIPIIDASSTTSLYQTFREFKGSVIRKLIVHRGITTYNSAFYNATNLTDIEFEGEIASTIAFSQSAYLSSRSVQSIIDCLVDLTDDTAQTVAFSNQTVLTPEQVATITNKNWTLAGGKVV